MTFMVAAYLIIWAAAFAFIFLMIRRQTALQREISALRELIDEKRDERPAVDAGRRNAVGAGSILEEKTGIQGR